MNQLRKDGFTKVGMYYSERGGVIVIPHQSLAKTKEIVIVDTGVINHSFNVDPQKLSLFYEACLEGPK